MTDCLSQTEEEFVEKMAKNQRENVDRPDVEESNLRLAATASYPTSRDWRTTGCVSSIKNQVSIEICLLISDDLAVAALQYRAWN